MASELHRDVFKLRLFFFHGLHFDIGRVFLHRSPLLVSLRVKHLEALALADPFRLLRALFEEMEGFSLALYKTGGLF